jgi:hypothetical protein
MPDISKITNEAERKFAECYFDHDEWEHQPEGFILEGIYYRPDFRDKKSNTYIEVVGTRQAMSHNMAKYVLLRLIRPDVSFELRNSNGELIPIESFRCRGGRLTSRSNILACPWCGSPASYMGYPPKVCIACEDEENCFALGPQRKTDEEAVASWNALSERINTLEKIKAIANR